MENEKHGIIVPRRCSGMVLRLPCLPGDVVRFKGLQNYWMVNSINLYAEGKPTASVTSGKITQTMPLAELADTDIKGRIAHPVIDPFYMNAWIPAARELPSRESCVKHYSMYGASPQFIVMIFGAIFPTVLSFDGNEFFNEETNETYRVTHWMELPTPPAREGT